MSRLNHEAVEEMARRRGLKMTPQRRMIVEFLRSATTHPTAEQVFAAVNEKFPMASRATVYNTLNWLRDGGLLRDIHEGGETRFDPHSGTHHHFVCRSCGAIEDVESDDLGPMPTIQRGGGGTVESVEVVIRGLCAQCAR